MSLRVVLSNSLTFRGANEYTKGAVVYIESEFTMLPVMECSLRGVFRHLSNYVFGVP